MAKDLSAHQQKIVNRYYEHHDTIQSTKLQELVSELWLADSDKAKARLWGKAQVALMRMGVDANRVASVVGKQDMEALAKLVTQADAGTAQGQAANAPRVPSAADGRTIKQMREENAAESGRDSLEEPNLKRALKAFRKKLKAMRLDDESRLGNRYTTGGRVSGITAITPPNEYPPAVWQKLAELGRLNKAGQGMYELPKA